MPIPLEEFLRRNRGRVVVGSPVKFEIGQIFYGLTDNTSPTTVVRAPFRIVRESTKEYRSQEGSPRTSGRGFYYLVEAAD